MDSISEICDHAQPYGITISLENFDRDGDKKCLVGPSRESNPIAERVRALGHHNFGLTIDLSHLPLLGDPQKRRSLLPGTSLCTATWATAY